MSRRIPEVTAYIDDAAPFARAIMKRIRTAAHAAHSKDAPVTEAMKWSCPAFMGQSILANMAAFKEHVRFGFWRGFDLKSLTGPWQAATTEKMCAWKVTSVKELPPKEAMVAWFEEAISIEAQIGKPGGPKKRAFKRDPKRKVTVPADFAAALDGNAASRSTFDGFSYSKRKDYIEWITEAKREATRAKRILQAVEWLAEGKSRNWRYEKR